MTFGAAIVALRDGSKVTRSGWNGKNMYLFLISSWSYIVDGVDKTTYPHLPFIAMKTADNKIVPWLASQTDILATDWIELIS